MNRQAEFIAGRRAETWQIGRDLRDRCLEWYCSEYGLTTPPPPAKIIPEVLRDHIGASLSYTPLPSTVFAQTEFKDGGFVVSLNSLAADIDGVRDAEGVLNVAGWHEAIHISRDAHVLKNAQPSLLEGFEAPSRIVCFRSENLMKTVEEKAREFFAEEAGRAAAVSHRALTQSEAFRTLGRGAGRLPSAQAWRLLYLAATDISVNISALVKQLSLEGLIVVEREGGSQLLHVQPGLRHMVEAA